MASSAGATTSRSGEFERQRGELLKEIAESFELVLANINKLNRNLEAVITVGNEFSSVEALWSTFENVMGKEEEGEEQGPGNDNAGAEPGVRKSDADQNEQNTDDEVEESHMEA